MTEEPASGTLRTAIPNDPGSLLDRTRRAALGAVGAAGFWGAILLPFAYLPFLYGGVGSRQLEQFFALLLLNAVCIVVGHYHVRGGR